MVILSRLWALALVVVYPITASAGEPLHTRIDSLLNVDAKVAAPLADDAEFLRRASIDLTGCIPTSAAARAFFNDADPEKRTKLIGKLLESPEHARQLQQVYDVMLMERRGDAKVPRPAWEAYLLNATTTNKPYDVLIREILSNDGSDPKTRPAAKFLLDRGLDIITVTRDISRLFLGRNIQCAQCHDHPNVDDYKQEEFYSLQAFYNRAFLYPNAEAPAAVIAEKAEGEVSFISVFDPKKVAKTSPPKMLGRKPIVDPKLEKGKEYKVAPAKDVKPVPAYSRFAGLGAELATAENRAFARTAANRLWAMLMGRGIVHPLDYDHSANPPSHPALLEMLTDELVRMKFDVRSYIREIALSQAYQRSSVPRGEMPAPQRFAVAALKPLSPEQFAHCILQATGYSSHLRATLPKATEPEFYAKLAPAMVPFTAKFRSNDSDEFAATLEQTLFVKYGKAIDSLLVPKPGNLFERCAKLDDSACVDEVFLSVLTRLPGSDEKAAAMAMLKSSKERTAALSSLVWALLASSEFRFNH